MEFDLAKVHDAAIKIAKMGGDHTLNYFNKNVEVQRKDDDSPVTIADQQAEEVMRKEIERLFPNHGILGEEHGKTNEESSVQWILDPIDGTKSFIHGVPLYTTLVGVLVDEKPVTGVIYAPALGELCDAAKGKGTRLNGKPCSVRPCDSLDEATFLSTDATTSSEFGFGNEFQALLDKTRINRTWGDAYGHMLVATGRADIMFDPVLNIWDAAPLLNIMQEAGGIFCDVHGKETIHTGNGISCSKELLSDVLGVFSS
ncbi:MAG: inositol monophosphatase family protein [Balneolaceae bacterium]|nr:inositol monophosphatase family protein [Balneolaceae bacterium]